MMTNGTVLGVAPLGASLAVIFLILTLLFTFIEPAASAGLPLLPRLVFWVLHIGTGLVNLLLASVLLRRFGNGASHLWWSLTLSGVIGTVIAAPTFYWLESWFPSLSEHPSHSLELWAYHSNWRSIVVEALEIGPILLLTWYAINLPLILNKPTLYAPPPPPEPPKPSTTQAHKTQQHQEAAQRQQLLDNFFSNLPEVIGSDVVALSSDLHYLNVHTAQGKTLILGSLKRYVDAFADQGLQIHRSHWVAKKHVTHVHISSDEAYCLLSNGLRVPISRSKRKMVKEVFGTGAVKHRSPTHLRCVK